MKVYTIRVNELPQPSVAEELEELVRKYQAGDVRAAELLRRRFVPLIYKLSHRQTIYNIFGEDAENMAWLLFFDFIAHYQGCDFARLPGLVKRFLIFRMMRKVEHCSLGWRAEAQLENKTQPDAVEDTTLPQVELQVAVQQELQKLPRKQAEILQRYYIKQQTHAQIAQLLHCSVRTVGYQREKALAGIRKNLEIQM